MRGDRRLQTRHGSTCVRCDGQGTLSHLVSAVCTPRVIHAHAHDMHMYMCMHMHMSHIVSSVLSFYNCWLEYSKRVQRVLLLTSCTRILADGSHTNPGRHELACRDVSEQRASLQTDHLRFRLATVVCKLIISTCQSANSSILQTCEGVD